MSYPTHILTANEYQQVIDLIVGLADRAAIYNGDAFRTVREELMEMITSDDINLRRLPRVIRAPLLLSEGEAEETKQVLLQLHQDIAAIEPNVKAFDDWLQQQPAEAA